MRSMTLLRSALFAACASCDQLHAESRCARRHQAAKKIRIAIDLGLPPYGMTDEKDAADRLRRRDRRLLAKDFGVEFELVPTTGATRIPSLQSARPISSSPRFRSPPSAPR